MYEIENEDINNNYLLDDNDDINFYLGLLFLDEEVYIYILFEF